MSDLVGNPEDRFSRVAAQMMSVYSVPGTLIVVFSVTLRRKFQNA